MKRSMILAGLRGTSKCSPGSLRPKVTRPRPPGYGGIRSSAGQRGRVATPAHQMDSRSLRRSSENCARAWVVRCCKHRRAVDVLDEGGRLCASTLTVAPLTPSCHATDEPVAKVVQSNEPALKQLPITTRASARCCPRPHRGAGAFILPDLGSTTVGALLFSTTMKTRTAAHSLDSADGPLVAC